MTNEITRFTGQGVQLSTFDDAVRFAKAVYDSGMAPKGFNNAQAVLVAMQSGMELGLSPMRAIQSVAVVNGRAALWGDAMLAIAKSSGLVESVIETAGDTSATCVVRLRDGEMVSRTFSIDDAKTAGLWNKTGPWTQYPKRMLQMRARSFALRDAVPEALCGFTSREEMDDHRDPYSAKDITPVRQETADPILDILPLVGTPSGLNASDSSLGGSVDEDVAVAAEIVADDLPYFHAGSPRKIGSANLALKNLDGEVRYFAEVAAWCIALIEIGNAAGAEVSKVQLVNSATFDWLLKRAEINNENKDLANLGEVDRQLMKASAEYLADVTKDFNPMAGG